MSGMDAVISDKSAEEHAENRAENREELLRQFVGSSFEYYSQNFARIGAKADFTWTFNIVAALLGPSCCPARQPPGVCEDVSTESAPQAWSSPPCPERQRR